MECERLRPASIDPTLATQSLESFLWGDPKVTLSHVRELFRQAAQLGREAGCSPWIILAHDAAACIVMGIDPVTGKGITDADEVIDRYENYSHFTALDIRVHVEAISRNVIMQQALQQERRDTAGNS